MQGGTTRRRVVSHFSTKIPLRRYFSGPAAVGYSLLFVSLLLTPYVAVVVGFRLEPLDEFMNMMRCGYTRSGGLERV